MLRVSMTRIVLLAVAVLLAAVPCQATTCAPYSANQNDAFDPRGIVCAGYDRCVAAFCTCMGSAANSTRDAELCATNSSATCAATTACLATFLSDCLIDLAVAASENTMDACAPWAVTLQAELLLASAGGSYGGSVAQRSCQRLACTTLRGNARLAACPRASNSSDVCFLPADFVVPTDVPLPTTTDVPSFAPGSAASALSVAWAAAVCAVAALV